MRRCLYLCIIALASAGCVRHTTYRNLAERDIQQQMYSFRNPFFYVGSDARFDYFRFVRRYYRVDREFGVLEPRMPLTYDPELWVEVWFDTDHRPYPADAARARWRFYQDNIDVFDENRIEFEPINWWEPRPEMANEKAPR